MKQIAINGKNVRVDARSWGFTINGQELDKLLHNALASNDGETAFFADVTIVISEVKSELVIEPAATADEGDDE